MRLSTGWCILDVVQIRLRERQDLIHIEAIARALHASDDYPRYRPDDDVAGLLSAPEMISSLVAVTNGTIVGHVALHWRSSRQVVDLVVDRLGVAAARLGVVARLLVDPSIRRFVEPVLPKRFFRPPNKMPSNDVSFRFSMLLTSSRQRSPFTNDRAGNVLAR